MKNENEEVCFKVGENNMEKKKSLAWIVFLIELVF